MDACDLKFKKIYKWLKINHPIQSSASGADFKRLVDCLNPAHPCEFHPRAYSSVQKEVPQKPDAESQDVQAIHTVPLLEGA